MESCEPINVTCIDDEEKASMRCEDETYFTKSLYPSITQCIKSTQTNTVSYTRGIFKRFNTDDINKSTKHTMYTTKHIKGRKGPVTIIYLRTFEKTELITNHTSSERLLFQRTRNESTV